MTSRRGVVRCAVALLATVSLSACDGARDGAAAQPALQSDGQQGARPPGGANASRTLRVCADPNNLPFSNEAQEGFENAIATLVAGELDARVEYTWWAQRRGYVRNTLRAGTCDVFMGVPASMEMTLATRPYYRSTYVFVTRDDAALDITTLDDARLRTLRVGVQLVGDDYTNTPPAHALARRGIIDNVHGYSLYGDYTQPNPPSRIIRAVADGEVDVAVAWGPMAAYFASRSNVPLRITPVSPQIDLPFLPMVYDVAMGVRRDDATLRDELQRIIEKRRQSIDSILAAYHVPRVDHRDVADSHVPAGGR